jgi:hopanoid biosynthesis associated RND transporter like protein HpnN
MTGSFEKLFGGIAAALAEFSSSRPLLVVSLCIAFTAGSLWAAGTSLEVDTDADRIMSPDIPVRQTNLALEAAFPDLHRNLVVMVEADDPHDARTAAEELSAQLRRFPERYPEVFLPGDDPFYEDFGLYYLDRDPLDELAARIENAGPLLAALAERPSLPILLGGLTRAVETGEGLDELGEDGIRILDRVASTVEASLMGNRSSIEWGDLLFDDVSPEPDEPQLFFVRPAGDLTQLAPVLDAIEDIRRMAAGLAPREGLRVRVTGDRAVHSEEMSLVIDEAIVSGVLSLIVVTAILFYCFRSLKLLIATVLTLLVGLAWTAGLAALAVGQLNALTSAFAVIYIGLAVDFGIHFGLGYLEQLDRNNSRAAAIRLTGRTVGSSLLLCALTTAIAFYSFIPTDYTGVADMGIISGTGVLLGLLATLTFYPALISLGLGESKARTRNEPLSFDLRLPTFPSRYPRTVCAAGVVVTLASCTALAWLRFDVNTLNVRDPRVESVQALKDLVANSERSVWTIEVLTQDLEEARALAPVLEALDGVHHVYTAEGFLPEDQADRLEVFRRMRSDLETPTELTAEDIGDELDRTKAVDYTIEGYRVALDIDAQLRAGMGDDDLSVVSSERLRTVLEGLQERLGSESAVGELDLLEEDLFGGLPELMQDVLSSIPARTVGLEDLPRSLVRRYLTPDGRARVEIFASTPLSEPGALDRFSDLIHTIRPDAGGPAAGSVALGRAIVGSLQQALTTAVIVIAILLLLLWRSFKYMLITLAPLFIGSAATAAASVLLEVPFNFANIIVLPLILGIGVDSGIHLVHRHRLGESGPMDLLRTSTARAVLFSALTTAGSFATLAFSNHLGISSLAQLLTLGIALMLAANVIVLPAILALVDP